MGLGQTIRDKIVAELVAYGVAGHHTGLPDRLGTRGLDDRLRSCTTVLDPCWTTGRRLNASSLLPPLNLSRDQRVAAFQLALLGRMIFSCLVDADFKDTEKFYAGINGFQPDRSWPALPAILPQLIARWRAHMGKFGAPASTIDVLRAATLQHVMGTVSLPAGIYTCTMPTGSGKTLATLGWGLEHAARHGHQRLIYCAPFTAIIDQTADIYRDVLGQNDVVLEHHSALEPAPGSRLPVKHRLATEDWAAPVVITTNVQFFESLMAARSSRCRKLHNVANSVIILDEAQTLPRQLLVPIARLMDELANNYGCTLLLCTATQPALDAQKFPAGHRAGLPLAGREIAPNPALLAQQFKRASIVRVGTLDDPDLIAATQSETQALVIVNTRRHCRDVFELARASGRSDALHLSTRQYATHRRRIIAEARRRLSADEPVLLVSTSVVEAGVDIDFPKVWRAEAGLDQIAQSAGRCNREGRRPLANSIVTVFMPPGAQPAPEVRQAAADMRRVFRRHPDVLAPAAMDDFMHEVYWRITEAGMDKGSDNQSVLGHFRTGQGGTDFAYRSAADAFEMIIDTMLPVIVPIELKAQRAVAGLADPTLSSNRLARDLQTAIVQVPRRVHAALLAGGHVQFGAQALRGDQFPVLTNLALYDPDIGLRWEDI